MKKTAGTVSFLLGMRTKHLIMGIVRDIHQETNLDFPIWSVLIGAESGRLKMKTKKQINSQIYRLEKMLSRNDLSFGNIDHLRSMIEALKWVVDE